MKILASWASCLWREVNQYFMTSTSRKQHQQVSIITWLITSQEGQTRTLWQPGQHIAVSHLQHPPLGWSTLVALCWAGADISASWEAIWVPSRRKPPLFLLILLLFQKIWIFSFHYLRGRFVNLYFKSLLQIIFRMLPRMSPTFLMTSLQCLNMNFSINFLPVLATLFPSSEACHQLPKKLQFYCIWQRLGSPKPLLQNLGRASLPKLIWGERGKKEVRIIGTPERFF